MDFGGVGIWNGGDVLCHFVDDRLSFVTSIKKYARVMIVGVSGFIVGVGRLIVRVCLFLFFFFFHFHF